MNPRIVNLSEMFGGPVDREREEILKDVAEKTLARLKEMSGENELALEYSTRMFSYVTKHLDKRGYNSAPGVPNILRIIADATEENTTRLKALRDKRMAEQASNSTDNNDRH